METIIHKRSKTDKRIYFLYPKREEGVTKHFTEIDKKKAKGAHRLAKRNNPALFEEKRQELMKYLFDSFTENNPDWGAFKFTPVRR